MLENIIERIKTKELIKTAIICLISSLFLSIAAQISIPLPGGVPMTLQTFSIALLISEKITFSKNNNKAESI